MPHVPLKVLRGQQDEEDIQDQYYERFQAPPGTSTEEEAERAVADDSRTSYSSDEDITTDMGEVSEEGTGRSGSGLDRSVGSVHSIRQSDNASIEEATGRYLGRHTSSIDNVSQSDTASDEAIELQGFAQVHHPPNTESDVASICNISEEIMQRYLGEHTGSINSASQSNTFSHERVVNVHNDQIDTTGYEASGSVSLEDIEMQVLPQTHQLPNTDNDDSDV